MNAAEEQGPAAPRARRPKVDLEAIAMQVARLALTLRSATLLLENVALDLGLDVGQTPGSLVEDERHVKPKTPAGAKVHVEPTIDAWLAGKSNSLSPKVDEAAARDELELELEDEAPPSSRPTPSSSSSSPPPSLKKGMRAILEVLAAVGMPLSKQRIATLTGISLRSGTFASYLSTLRTSNMIVDVDGQIEITDAGMIEAGDVAPRSHADLRAMWEQKLKRGELEILAALSSVHPKKISRTQLATLAGMSPKGGTFTSYLSHLRVNALLVEDGGKLSLSDEGKIVAPVAQARDEGQILARWTASLKEGERRMLDAILRSKPQYITYGQISAASGISEGSGTFASYLSHLRSNGLIETVDRRARAGEAFR